MRAVVLLFALSLDAQILGTLTRLPDGREEIKVLNQSAVGVEAFAVKVTPSSTTMMRGGRLLSYGPLMMFFDPIVDQSSALATNEERSLMVRGPAPRNQRIFEEPVITAGIFADRTIAGDTNLLIRLLTRRRNTLQAIETSLELLASESPRNQVDEAI